MLPFNDFLRLDRHDRLLTVLQALPAEPLLRALESEHPRGRSGYPARVLWACLIAGIVSQVPTIAELRRHLAANPHLRLVCGLGNAQVPSAATFTRFLQRLVCCQAQVDQLLTTLVRALGEHLPRLGQSLAWIAPTSTPGPGGAKLASTPTPVGRPKGPKAPARSQGPSSGGLATSCISWWIPPTNSRSLSPPPRPRRRTPKRSSPS